jgi:hypothetical protein
MGMTALKATKFQKQQGNNKENTMRKIVALAALVSFMPVANAADGGEMKTNAEYRVRYQIDQAQAGSKDDETIEHTAGHRFKLDFGFKSGEKFSAHATLLHNAVFGDATAGNGTDNQEKNGITNSSNMVLVNQAYGTWMINDQWNAKFGRGGFTMADGSVISQNDWESTPYSFDGALLNYEHEMFRLNLFGVKAADLLPDAGNFTDNDDPEVNFFGFAIDWKSLPEFLKMANLHLVKTSGNRYSAPAEVAGQDAMRYGLVLAGDTAGVDYKAIYAANMGETNLGAGSTDVNGSMMHFEVGYSMPEMMKSRFYVGYHSDTGNDTTTGDEDEGYDTFFYEKHCGSGCMDVLNWGNLSFIKAGYTFSPMDQVDVGLHYWKFERESDNAAATLGNNGAYAANTGAATDDTDLGSEIDLVASKKYDNGFTITTWVGMFMPGAYFKDEGNNDDTFNQFFVEGKMTF